MAANDYMNNPEDNIILAMFEENLKDYNGNEFNATGTITFDEDSQVGKYMIVPKKGYLTIENPDLALGNSDFTMDFWCYNKGNFCCITTGTKGKEYGLGIEPDPMFKVAYVGAGFRFEIDLSIQDVPLNEWRHFAFVRKDGIGYVFSNGVLQTSKKAELFLDSTKLVINASYSDNPTHFNDSENYYKALRICNFARWVEDFTPPNPDVDEPTPGPGECCIPVGSVIHLTSTVVPKGWLFCDGSIVSKDKYKNLYEVVGTIYGECEDEKMFKLPDLRGEFIRGYDADRGLDSGRVFGSEQEDALQNHSHGGVISRTMASEVPPARVADETRPHNVALLPCIKY